MKFKIDLSFFTMQVSALFPSPTDVPLFTWAVFSLALMAQPLYLAVQDSKKENGNETRAGINGSIHISGHVMSGG